jgi:hypothetical protein
MPDRASLKFRVGVPLAQPELLRVKRRPALTEPVGLKSEIKL